MIWAPYSPCAVGCLVGDEDRVPISTAVLRIVALLAAVLAVIPLAVVYPLLSAAERTAVAGGWCRSLLRALDVRMVVDAPAEAPAGALVVANHISWLDILAVGSVRPGRMVAKNDVRGWPLIGALATRGGTIFVDRHRLSTLPGTVADVRTALLSGSRVVAFPEGTTWCGAERGRFYPAVFQAAIDAGAPVEPVTVRYTAAGRPTTVPAFLGDDPLTASAWRIARARDVVVEVRCHPVLAPGGDRRTLAAAAAASVSVVRPRVDRLVGVHPGEVVDSHPA
ncbi:lysophospholipid acyltransferase family protein [Cryptosporangium arvum]|uniref:1-acyl-sn-glycerol-3-phosphate acyltransferase n=1 Tax=Cryptosporangium arvum DSM 44712 TaxID=927661 RepID=A0A010YWM8_9ACTN|nr:lysophospholipid acyltransferase family protein [Cryptosporangium arvum]EXG79558.1 1-acyl-sn-glycerol-3-phosphate acyltransferase [Cryptosporangium arvum DSM 44712]